MRPKEQAFHLFFKFYRDIIADEEKAQQCALVAVNQLIKETGAKYWYEVKQEVENIKQLWKIKKQ
jgi:hypothetical protein